MRENDFFCRFIKHLWGDSKSFLLGVLKKIHFLLNRKKRRRKSIDIYLSMVKYSQAMEYDCTGCLLNIFLCFLSSNERNTCLQRDGAFTK